MRRAVCLALIGAMLLCLCGCGGMFSETYVSRHPHEWDEEGDFSSQRHAASYPEIYTALTALIGSGVSDGVIILTDLSEQVGRSYMEAAIRNVMSQDPMAIYCVVDIRFDLGSNAGRLAAAVHLDYSKTPAELASVKTAQTMQDAQRLIGQALEEAVGFVAIHVEGYEQIDLNEFIMQYINEHPATVMEIPQVKISSVPATGQNRVLELVFTYRHSQKDLVKMRSKVEPVFTAAELYVQGDSTTRKKFQQLHAFLMERFEYELRSTDTPTYSLLQDGVGDSRAFACVYADMCRRADLECRVIMGTKDGGDWYWNRVVIDNRVYYIDLIEAERTGKLLFRTSSEMSDYSWDRNR